MMRWLNLLNLGLLLALGLMSLGFLFVWLGTAQGGASREPDASTELELPRNPFSRDDVFSEEFRESPLFALRLQPTSAQLPDLRPHLTYVGRNGRPDVEPSSVLLHLLLRGSEESVSVAPQERVYLRYVRERGQASYTFSDENIDTGLWIEVSLVGSGGPGIEVEVGMVDPQGTPITRPEEFARFRLTPKGNGPRGTKWQVGEHRADASLLARLRARWYGPDRFLELLGGEEYASFKGRERIDFGDGEGSYAVFVGEEGGLIWKDDRWHEAEIGPETRGYPLLHLKKINGKLLNFELWDLGGKGRVQLNLIRSRPQPIRPRLFRDVRVIGSKTLRQAIIEIGEERLVVSQNDWLLATKEGWRLLATVEEIDDFVSRRLRGELWIVGQVQRREGHQVLTGYVFDSARSEVQKVELPIGVGGKGDGAVFEPASEIEEQPEVEE